MNRFFEKLQVRTIIITNQDATPFFRPAPLDRGEIMVTPFPPLYDYIGSQKGS